jgi:MYXO-CTERM domain-containing protein
MTGRIFTAAAAALLTAGSAFAGGTFFDLTGPADNAAEFNFSEAGIDLTASSRTRVFGQNINSFVTQRNAGLGVAEFDCGPLPLFPDVNVAETLKLNFSQDVVVKSIHFGNVDRRDSAKVRIALGSDTFELNSLPNGVLDLSGYTQAQRTTDFINISVPHGWHNLLDGFTVSGVELDMAATPIPSPAAAPAGLALLAGLGLRRRRRQQA